jgi:DNA-binding response OmpR family regulator
MNRSEFEKAILQRLEAGLSVHVSGLPEWGLTRFVRELENGDRVWVKLDAHLKPFALPHPSQVDEVKPTTFVIDHFDSLLETQGKAVFNHLRSLRDLRKDQVTYLITTTNIHDLSKYAELLDSFYVMASMVRFYFPACNAEETDEAIDEVARLLGGVVSSEARAEIYLFSGGIPGLIKLWFSVGQDRAYHSARVRALLVRIWQGLSDDWQQQLVELIAGRREQVDESLIERGVVQEGEIRSRALHDYVQFRLSQLVKIDQVKEQPAEAYQTNADAIGPLLTKIEHRLFVCLRGELGSVAQRDRLRDCGWPNDEAEGVSDEALDQAISRLRRKLKKAGGYELKTVKGRGYLLKEISTV